MEKTINEVKKNAKTLENDILKLISDFEVANPEVEVRVTVGRNYSTVEDGKITHRADVDLTINICGLRCTKFCTQLRFF